MFMMSYYFHKIVLQVSDMFPVPTEARNKAKDSSISHKEEDQFQALSDSISNSGQVASPMLQEIGGCFSSSSDIFYYTALYDCSSTFAQALSFQKGIR